LHRDNRDNRDISPNAAWINVLHISRALFATGTTPGHGGTNSWQEVACASLSREKYSVATINAQAEMRGFRMRNRAPLGI
jgi:hypothetical protein